MSGSTLEIGSYLMAMTRDGVLPELILPGLLLTLVVLLRIRLSRGAAPAAGSALARYADSARRASASAVASQPRVTVVDFAAAARRRADSVGVEAIVEH